ncbi:hypothetical protein Tchl_0907 [Thauera chlorobenzoica]|uniref:Uncharacterized protein n=2 Tax=Thauera chlorobenzoica TaxID=96773 RepID=A0A1L6FA60_9RHOO|nr:hypothetical protein Tchl_0907 [Thauera chlorobenzoica]
MRYRSAVPQKRGATRVASRRSQRLDQRSPRRRMPQERVVGDLSSGIPLEAQLENAAKGVYHGYPMPESDPLAAEVLSRWSMHD